MRESGWNFCRLLWQVGESVQICSPRFKLNIDGLVFTISECRPTVGVVLCTHIHSNFACLGNEIVWKSYNRFNYYSTSWQVDFSLTILRVSSLIIGRCKTFAKEWQWHLEAVWDKYIYPWLCSPWCTGCKNLYGLMALFPCAFWNISLFIYLVSYIRVDLL